MANEVVIVLGTPKTLEASGGSITSGSVVQANDANYSISADGAYYPSAKFVLGFTFSSTPAEGSVLALYARPLDVDGTNDTEVPESTRPTVYIGSFVVNNVTTAQYAELVADIVPWAAEYYVHNNGTGQTVSAGWTLKVTPCTVKPA